MNISLWTPDRVELEQVDLEALKALFAKVWWENAGMVDDNLENISKTSQEYDLNVRVFSAMRTDNFNTTDHLVKLAEHLKSWEIWDACDELDSIEQFHFDLLDSTFSDFWEQKNLQNMITQEFDTLRLKIGDGDNFSQLSAENDYSIWEYSILWFWEIISAKIYHQILQDRGMDSHYLDTTELWWNIANIEVLAERFRNILLEILKSGEKNVMVPGFIAGLEWGILNFFERWYSDATAWVLSQVALLIDGATENTFGFETVVLNIQKSVDGFLTTDPRLLKDGILRAKLVEEISVSLAQRIISDYGAHAKLLNEETLNTEVVKLLRENEKFKLWVNNPFWDSQGTFISGVVEAQKPQVQFILTKKQLLSEYRNVVGVSSPYSLYLMWERLLAGDSEGTPWIIDELLDVLVSKRIKYSQTYMMTGLKETIGVSFETKEKSLEALDVLHKHYFEESPDKNFAEAA